MTDTLTKVADTMNALEWCEYEDLAMALAKAAARVILDSPEVIGLVDLAKNCQKVDNEMLNFMNGFGDKPKVDEQGAAFKALASFQKLKESVGE